MNSACIIAACAANARRINQQHQNYTQYLSRDFDLYYKINFRMYVHFRPIKIIKPEGDDYIGSVYAPFRATLMVPAQIEAKTVAKQRTFKVKANDCLNGPYKYVKDNLERYTSSDLWQLDKEDIINNYIEEVQKEHNIILDKSYLDYTIQHCWEVDLCD